LQNRLDSRFVRNLGATWSSWNGRNEETGGRNDDPPKKSGDPNKGSTRPATSNFAIDFDGIT
jgi:hypothetical protein